MSDLRLPEAGTIEVAASILSADFAELADEIAQVEAAGVKMIHLDVMDGHFVPNITIGAPVVAKLREHSKLMFDTHLMISEPKKYAESFVKAGSNHLTFHIEAVSEPAKLIEYIHSLGVTCGVSLNPETPVEAIEEVAGLCDMILVMTVHPGFGSQKFLESAAKKCKRIREILGARVRVEVDGGINPVTAPIAVSYGADTFVAGSAVFSKPDRAKAVEAIVSACKNTKSCQLPSEQ
jgi:ribulose-phosphate 3-epimerase